MLIIIRDVYKIIAISLIPYDPYVYFFALFLTYILIKPTHGKTETHTHTHYTHTNISHAQR